MYNYMYNICAGPGGALIGYSNCCSMTQKPSPKIDILKPGFLKQNWVIRGLQYLK